MDRSSAPSLFGPVIQSPSRCRPDISIDLAFENFERDCSGAQHSVMELLEGEAIAERFSGFVTKLQDFQFADHICASLAGVDDVSFHFAGLDAVVYGLLAGPVFRVDPGI